MSNKITSLLFRCLAVALVASSLIGCTETILSEHESKNNVLADSIPKRGNPSVNVPSDEKNDTIKIAVDFDTEWEDTVNVDVAGE